MLLQCHCESHPILYPSLFWKLLSCPLQNSCLASWSEDDIGQARKLTGRTVTMLGDFLCCNPITYWIRDESGGSGPVLKSALVHLKVSGLPHLSALSSSLTSRPQRCICMAVEGFPGPMMCACNVIWPCFLVEQEIHCSQSEPLGSGKHTQPIWNRKKNRWH